MFGYLRLDGNCPGFIKKEYRKHYCFLCRSIQKYYGLLPRLSLSYDAAFFMLFALNDSILHGVSKVPCLGKSAALQDVLDKDISLKIASFNILLSAKKLEDNVLDEKSAAAGLASAVFKNTIESAERNCPDISEILDAEYAFLRDLEKEKAGLVFLEDAFSNMMARLAGECFNVSDPSKLESLKAVSKWLYCIDALDDLDEDIKKNMFNPLSEYGSFDNLKNKNYNRIFRHFREIFKSSGIPDCGNICDVIINRLIFYGIPDVTSRVLLKERRVP